MGVHVHGKKTTALVDLQQWPHGSSFTITCLLKVLAMASTDNKLPPVLYIQLDNCSRENKNKYFLAVMAIIILKGIVNEVIISFLMVGHTHEGKTFRFDLNSNTISI